MVLEIDAELHPRFDQLTAEEVGAIESAVNRLDFATREARG